MRQCISYSIYSKKAYDSVSRKVLYNILVELEAPMKLVRPIKCFQMKHIVASI
jgi:hypothetical protein